MILALTAGQAVSAPIGISSVNRSGSVAWTNAYEFGVVSVLTATNVNGPWQPRENYFTTNAVGGAQVQPAANSTFCRLRV